MSALKYEYEHTQEDIDKLFDAFVEEYKLEERQHKLDIILDKLENE